MTLRNDTTAEQIVDCLAENRMYEKAGMAINKIDIATEEDLQRLLRQALGQEERTQMLSKVTYQADGGLINAAR